MDRRLALAFDPGNITGAAMWGADGYLWSKQGSSIDVLHAVVTHKRLADVATLIIEGQFVNPRRIHGAIPLVRSSGRLHGALLFSALPRDVYLNARFPQPKEWRRGFGWAALPSDEAKAEARRHAGVVTGDPAAFRTLSSSNEAEAICMAEDGYQSLLG